jgi:Ion channel
MGRRVSIARRRKCDPGKRLYALRFIVGFSLVFVTLLDGFGTILVPRRINNRFRYSRLYYRATWAVIRRLGIRLRTGRFRESMLGIFGPMSLLGLFVLWMTSLVFGFALLQWSTSHPLMGPHAPAEPDGFLDCLYFSGTTCFTLGLGDITPRHGIARLYTVAESGVGYGFLAIIIGYLPVLYQAFSRREITVTLLDARAGSPPSAGEYLLRIAQGGRIELVDDVLRGWEQWCAELLESHVSFPVLTYYRSQHGNQSWLAALATMLDTSALLLTILPPRDSYQAQLTFAMARHAAVDISLIFAIPPHPPERDRVPAEAHDRLHKLLGGFGPPAIPPASAAAPAISTDAPGVKARLAELRGMYEPFLQGLADHFLLGLPPVVTGDRWADNWQRSAWMPRTPGIGSLPARSPHSKSDGDHFTSLR